MAFEVIPAIDLRGGRVVRLRRGRLRARDPLRRRSGGGRPGLRGRRRPMDPRRRPRRRERGAAADRRRRADRPGRRRARPPARSAAACGRRRPSRRCSGAGAARVVLGTAILRDAGLARTLIAAHGSGRPSSRPSTSATARRVGDGWMTGATGREVGEAVAALADAGVIRFVVTSIARDGVLGGPDLDLLERLVALDRGAIIASGGIASIADLAAVRDSRLRGGDRGPGDLRGSRRPGRGPRSAGLTRADAAGVRQGAVSVTDRAIVRSESSRPASCFSTTLMVTLYVLPPCVIRYRVAMVVRVALNLR